MIADELRVMLERKGCGPVDMTRAELRALADRVAELESRPCPHVVTTGTTSHCSLAERDARDAARYRWLRDNPWNDQIQAVIELRKNALWDTAIDTAMKEQADAEEKPAYHDPHIHGPTGV